MQSLDILSVNLWQILISLANLLILFLLLKKFLYAPINNMLAKRRAEIDSKYSDAEEASSKAHKTLDELEERLAGAKLEAESIVKEAASAADARGEKILEEAKLEAENIIRKAEEHAKRELKKTEETIKTQIVEVSTAISEKLLEREINADDHRALIDSFIAKMGEDNDSDI